MNYRLVLFVSHIIVFVSFIQAQTDITIIIQENETGLISIDGIIDTKHAGYTGTGFMDTDNELGKGITWEVCVPADGTYSLQWRYAYGKADNRTAKVLVNNTESISNVDFLPTGDFTVWDTTLAVEVTLVSGTNQIRMEATTAQGLANIDYMSITGKNPVAGFCVVGAIGVELTPTSVEVGVGDVKKLIATVLPAEATNINVRWKSEDSTIVKVNKNGIIEGMKIGSTKIIVTTEDGAFTDTCYVSTLTVPLFSLSTSVIGQGHLEPGAGNYAEGREVCITAIPASGWIFAGWSGDTTNSNSILCITMDSNISITAEFTKMQYAIPDGYAASEGTTGGGNTTPIIVTTASEFKSAISGDSPKVIFVNGSLDVGNVSVGSNTTIVGMNENSGLYGGTINADGDNYIFQNLTFGPIDDGDTFEVDGGTRVFITKCTFHDSKDELCSIVNGADYVTVSWCKFYFDNPDSHSYANLIGSSNDKEHIDGGKLHVTMHHNWYYNGTESRQPRVRFGHVHLYNNYHNSNNNSYCVGVGIKSNIRMEALHFDNQNRAWKDMDKEGAKIGWNNMKFENTEVPYFMPNEYPAFSVPYSFSIDPVDSIKSIVTRGAGNVFIESAETPTINISLTSPKDGDIFDDHSEISLEADGFVAEGTIDSVEFYTDNTLISVSKSDPYSYEIDSLPANNYKIIARAYNQGKYAISAVNIVVQGEPNAVNITHQNLDIELYPNPVSNELKIILNDNSDKANVSLFNSVGELIKTETLIGNELNINTEKLSKGVYIIKVSNNQVTQVMKIIKK